MLCNCCSLVFEVGLDISVLHLNRRLSGLYTLWESIFPFRQSGGFMGHIRQIFPKLAFGCLSLFFLDGSASAEDKKKSHQEMCKKTFKLSPVDTNTLKNVGQSKYNVSDHLHTVDSYDRNFVALQDKARKVHCQVFTSDGHEARYIYFIELF